MHCPEGEGPIHPAADQRRQGSVLSEPAAEDDDKILVRVGVVPGGGDAADDGARQHALKIDEDRGVGVQDRVPDLALKLRAGKIAGEHVGANAFPDHKEGAVIPRVTCSVDQVFGSISDGLV